MRFAYLAVFVSLFTGCAQVHIKKVVQGSGDDQEGMRFYRPRPFVAVNKPFPIGGGDAIIYGYIDAKQRVVAVDPRTLPPALRDLFPAGQPVDSNLTMIMGTGQQKTLSLIPFDAIGLPQQSAAGDKNSADPKPDDKDKSQGDKPTTKPTTRATTQESDVPKTKASFTSTTEAGEPLIKINDLIQIVYLPDFEENYVIRVDSPLGVGSADIALKYGWMIEHAKWEVDNRELSKFIFEQIEMVEKLGLSLVNPVAGAASAVPELEKKAAAADNQIKLMVEGSKEVAATPVILRVKYALEAQPGLYPVLKPWESIEGHRKSVKIAQRGGPNFALEDTTMPSLPALLPMRPYTVVAYNYRRVVVIELVTAGGSAGGGNSGANSQKPSPPK